MKISKEEVMCCDEVHTELTSCRGKGKNPPTIKCYACPCFQFPPTQLQLLLKLVIAKVLFHHKKSYSSKRDYWHPNSALV